MSRIPLTRQSSNDFVLVSGGSSTPIVSDNEKKNDFLLYLEKSPVSNRRSVRASKELSEEDKVSLIQRLQVNAQEESREFVMIHESPNTKRRALRASKELSADEQRELSISLSVEVASSSAMDETVPTAASRLDADEDELGVTVAPTPPPRKPSFRNGRRVSEPNPATHPQGHHPYAIRESAKAPEPRHPGHASADSSPSSWGDTAGLSDSSPLGKASTTAEPESPTSVTGQFFGDLLKNTSGNLLSGF